MTLDQDDGAPADNDADVDIMGNSSDIDIIDLDDYSSAGSITTCMCGHIHADVACTVTILKLAALKQLHGSVSERLCLHSSHLKHPCTLCLYLYKQFCSLTPLAMHGLPSRCLLLHIASESDIVWYVVQVHHGLIPCCHMFVV